MPDQYRPNSEGTSFAAPMVAGGAALLTDVGHASIAVIGLVVLIGIGGMTSFAQATFAGLSAYSTAVLTTVWGGSPWLGLALGVVIASTLCV